MPFPGDNLRVSNLDFISNVVILSFAQIITHQTTKKVASKSHFGNQQESQPPKVSKSRLQ